MGVLYPVLPLFFEDLEFTKTQIGMLTAITPLSSSLCGPLWSLLFDAYDWNRLGTILSHVMASIATIAASGVGSRQFHLMVGVVSISSILRAPVGAQIDAHTVGLVKRKYGDIRLYGAVSFGILSFTGGALTGTSASDFDAVFVLYGVFSVLSAGAMYQSRIGIDDDKSTGDSGSGNSTCSTSIGSSSSSSSSSCSSSIIISSSNSSSSGSSSGNSMTTSLIRGFSTPAVVTFLCVMVIAGTAFGIVESFLFIRLKQLGASGWLLGSARLIMCFSEVPMFRIAPKIHRRLGTWSFLLLTQVVFIVRNVYYAVLEHPIWVLPCEVLHGITFAAMWNTSISFAHAVAPTGLETTFQAVLSSVHFGIGCSIGGIVGGVVFDTYGGEALFWLNAFLCCMSASITAAAVVWKLHDEVIESGVLDEGDETGGDAAARGDEGRSPLYMRASTTDDDGGDRDICRFEKDKTIELVVHEVDEEEGAP